MICDKLINYKQSKSISHLSVYKHIQNRKMAYIRNHNLSTKSELSVDSGFFINEIRFDTMVGFAKSANPLYASIDNGVAKNAFILFKHHSCCIFTVK